MSRWGATEALAADWYRAHGWPYAQSGARPRTGADLTGMPGLAPEVKAVETARLSAWLRQAREHGGLPFVVWRPDGLGPAAIERWPVLMRLDDHTALLRAAGYGSES